ncbi:ureidoglycolate hydrolase-like protein [Pseudovirgaria hyperparasitica]|uniref:Ureidoglycolate hydrolase-like protein n=1 Tax=Pseudovirgaria hyperparasitica TaxID=470096 RepID=A0A6A6W5X0_9PEZI|nr:ureidoglycolate hydrolase-like protein [Pseudovirgaria hyperparasitica]KAF2758282.1 ureidoglycolate hydrolase-like protein [Pseudovirgaria hyperparasitica]
MPSKVRSPPHRISISPLTHSAFAPFGTVIENPLTSPSPATLLPQSVHANQGTAIKYLDVTNLNNHYPLAGSKRPAKAVINMFVCAPRRLRTAPAASTPTEDELDGFSSPSQGETVQLFDVSILERHPYTPQTFIPMGLPTKSTCSSSSLHTYYLVIVAPTLPSRRQRYSTTLPKPYPSAEPAHKPTLVERFKLGRPAPFTNDSLPPPSPAIDMELNLSGNPKGRGMPDLGNIKAFIARGNQAVTYGPGTWHAPMVVLGDKSVDFVVVQYANGIANEDCQEVVLERVKGASEGAVVEVDMRSLEKLMSARVYENGRINSKL